MRLRLSGLVRYTSKPHRAHAARRPAGGGVIRWINPQVWQAMSPTEGGKVPPRLEQKLQEAFGGVQQFKDAFKAAAVGQFGSGWAWLVLGRDGKLKVSKTPNGSTPLATGEGKALLGCDVWEHSYYLDFRNRRPDYVQNWLDKLANYEFAAAQL